MNSDRLASPVSGSCEAWWWSSSLSRPSCSSDCSSWPFSSAIAVWLASVSKSLRSSASNVLMSLSGSDTRSVPTSVDSPSSGATSALRTASGGRPRPCRLVGRQVDEPALALGDRADQDRIVEGRPDRLHDLDRVAGPDLAAQDLVALVPRQQPDLGDVGPEHLAGVVEQRDERGVELRAALEDPRRLVEQFDALVLLALRDVGPIGQRRGDRRQDEQPDRCRVRPQDGQGHQREARVRQRDDDPDLEHLGDAPVLGGPLGQRDRGADAQDADDVLDEGDQQDGDPDRRPEGPSGRAPTAWTIATETTEARLNWARLNASLTERWRRLKKRASAGADEAGDDERRRRDEEEPGDQRQLAHRERVRAATDVEVDDLGLGQVEAGGEQPDRDVDRDGDRQARPGRRTGEARRSGPRAGRA